VVSSNANRNGTRIATASQIANDVLAPTTNNLGSNDRSVSDLSLKLDYDLAGGVLTAISAATKLDEVVTYDGFDYSDNTYCIDFGTSPLYTPYNCATPQFTTGGSNGTPIFYSQPFNTTFQDYGVETYSQELRFTSRADAPWRYIAGAYFLKRNRDLTTATQEDKGFGIIPQLDFDPTTPNQTRSYFAEQNRDSAYALFAQLNHDLSEKLEFGVAVRYDSDRREQTDPRPDAYRVDGFGLPLSGPRTRSKTFSELQPKLTLTYKAARTLSFYTSYASGFRSGGFNAPGTEVNPFTGDPIANPVFRKEVSKNFEAGFKSEWFDRALSLNSAVFYSDVDDLQSFNFNGSVNAQVVANIDKVHIKGAELELNALLASGFSVFGGAGYSDAKIEEYAVNTAAIGNQVPYNTKLKVNVGTQWRHSLSGGLSSLVRVDLEHRGKTYFHEGGTPIGIPVRDSLNLVNARLGLETSDGWAVTLWGKNLGDEKYYSEVVVPAYAFQARPRTYGLEVRKDF
jgi:iron complex outermembrane receptor protein